MTPNEIEYHKGYYVSVAYGSTFDDDGKRINETALVFEENGRNRYWILKHDVSDIYEGKTLEEAKDIYRSRHENEACFWSDYDEEKDN